VWLSTLVNVDSKRTLTASVTLESASSKAQGRPRPASASPNFHGNLGQR
jgi:hypothetical protein